MTPGFRCDEVKRTAAVASHGSFLALIENLAELGGFVNSNSCVQVQPFAVETNDPAGFTIVDVLAWGSIGHAIAYEPCLSLWLCTQPACLACIVCYQPAAIVSFQPAAWVQHNSWNEYW